MVLASVSALFLTTVCRSAQADSRDSARLVLNSFDETAGKLPSGYWESGAYKNGSMDLNYVKDVAAQGDGALRIEYEVIQAETWGGFVSMKHHPNWTYILPSASHISFWYNVERPSSPARRVHLRLILLDSSECDNFVCTELSDAEVYYSFHHVLDGIAGWRQIAIPLEGSDAESSPFWRTGWSGTRGNGMLDPHAINGFIFEISIDGGGDIGSAATGVVLIDGLECSGGQVLSSAFQAWNVGAWWERYFQFNASEVPNTFSYGAGMSEVTSAALRVNYSVVQTETWGGFIEAGYLLPGVAYYNLSIASDLSFSLDASAAAKPAERAHFRFILLEGSDCLENCTEVPGVNLENYYSFHHVLDTIGVTNVSIALSGGDQGDSSFYLPGWSGIKGDAAMDKEIIKGFRIEISVDGSGAIGSVTTGAMTLSGLHAIGNQSDLQSFTEFSLFDKIILYLWNQNDTKKYSSVGGDDCAKLCSNDPWCYFFAQSLPPAEDNCVLANSVDAGNILLKDCYDTDNDIALSGVDKGGRRLISRLDYVTFTSGWIPARRPQACGSEGVCSCKSGVVNCSSSSIKIMPQLSREVAESTLELHLAGTGIEIITSALLGDLPKLRTLHLEESVSFFAQSALGNIPNLENLTSKGSLGDIIFAWDQRFTGLCCQPQNITVGLLPAMACTIKEKYNCTYEENFHYSEMRKGYPIVRRVKEFEPKFGWAATTPESCCELCMMHRGCTYFELDRREDEFTCYLRKNANGRTWEDEMSPRGGPGYVSGLTPEARAETRVVSVVVDLPYYVLSSKNNYSLTYNVSVSGDILRGAVWITLEAKREHDNQNITLVDAAFEPSTLVFYAGGPKHDQVSLNVKPPRYGNDFRMSLSHTIEGRDDAWNHVSDTMMVPQIDILPETCLPGEILIRETGHCTPCAVGRFHNVTNDTCESCAPGDVANMTGHTSCYTCGVGLFSQVADATNSAGSACVQCREGTFGSTQGLSACEACDSGRYAPKKGATTCEKCSDHALHATTLLMGASSQSDCRCKEGYRYTGSECMLCPQMLGLKCPGGHSITNTSQDLTPKLEAGYMSLPYAPLQPFFCVGREARCPDLRSPYTGTMCVDAFDADSPQCGRCLPDHYKGADGTCYTCKTTGVTISVVLHLGGVVVFELVCLWYMYLRWNRPNPPGLITFGSLVTFVQVLQRLGQLPLKWPDVLTFVLNFLDEYLTIPGIFNSFQVQYECIVGADFRWQFFRDIAIPLSPFVLFSFLACCARMFKSKLDMDCVINTIGVIFKGAFVAISGMTLMLFMPDVMPNGKHMVKNYPTVEQGDESWWSVFPLGILACAFYNVTFIAFVAHAVWMAPRWSSCWPGFVVRFRVAFGALRPDCWWWVLLQLCYGFGVTAIHVTSENAFVRIYLSILILLAVMLPEYRIQPFKFRQNNYVEGILKSSLLVFLILATSFIDYGTMKGDNLKRYQFRNAVIVVVILLLAFSFAVGAIAFWLAQQMRPIAATKVPGAKLAWQFRDVMMLVGVMQDEEFLRAVTSLGDADLLNLKQSMRTIVATFLKQQPGSKLMHQRVIPGAPFTIWSRQKTSLQVVESMVNGDMTIAAERHGRLRVALMKVAQQLRAHPHRHPLAGGERVNPHGISELIESALWALSSAQQLASAVGLDSRKSLNVEEFCDVMSMLTHDVSMKELTLVFEFLDQNGDGIVTVDEFVAVLAPAAPPLDFEQQHVLARLAETSGCCCSTHVNTDSPRARCQKPTKDDDLHPDLEFGLSVGVGPPSPVG